MSLLEALSAEFPKSEVRQRSGGMGIKLDYIDIVQTIQRLTGVLGANWHWEPQAHTIAQLDGVTDKNGNPIFLATVRGNIVVSLPEGQIIVRGGVGADKDADPDKALKTADAEALKKAGHKFGIALYLWDEGKRNEIAEYRKLEKASLSTVKQAVATKVGSTNRADIAKALGDVDDLDDREALLEFLAA